MAEPAEIPRKFVADARAAAVAVPVDPRAMGYEGPGVAPGEGGVLEVKLDGSPVSLRASEVSVRQVVATAYLIGGFELVLALDREVRERVRIEGLTLSQLKAAVESLPGEARKRSGLADVLREQMALIPLAERRLQTANNVLRMLHAAWARIAAAEEQVLREYEPLLINQFAKLALDAEKLALQEWARYEPYDVTASDVLPLSTSEAKERSADDLLLRNEAAELCDEVRKLHEAWKDYLDALDSTRRLVDLGASGIRGASGEDPARLVANSRKNNAAKFDAFDKRRSEIGERFPVALQLYGRIGKLSTDKQLTADEEIQGWAIEALIEAVESSRELAHEAFMQPVFKAGARLRVEPADPGGAAGELPGYQQDALVKGLTVPASRVIANRMVGLDETAPPEMVMYGQAVFTRPRPRHTQTPEPAKSPWFQLPVRSALFKRGTEGEQRLTPYFTPGRLHHAALSEVNTALKEVRRKEQEKVDQALLIIDAIALPAGFFTGGATVAIAGAVHAIVRANEMYESVTEYQARDALAQIALVPMQQAIWDHPSAVTLTGKLLEGGFEIATDLVNGGVAGAIMDAIQVSLVISYGSQAVAAWVASDDPLEDET